MATTMSKVLLSGSTNGKNIKVAATATPGTLIHTTGSGIINMDEVWLYAVNTASYDVILTIEYGGVVSPDDSIPLTVKAYQGVYMDIPGLILQNALSIRAFATNANVVNINGYVNRITVV
jgi:hypothetical protein